MIDNLVEVRLSTRDDFLKIAETLTRIGVKTAPNKLTQSCHILHKQGRYYICHYLELFQLDGFDRVLSTEDIMRRNAIVKLLEQWGLCTVVDPQRVSLSDLKNTHVVPYNQKSNYTLKQNYTIGKKKAQCPNTIT